MISPAMVDALLQPWLGPGLCEALFPLIEEITARLCSYTGSVAPDTLSAWLDSALFQAVRAETRGKMLIPLPDGGMVRVRVEDFAVMADELMYLPFAALPVDARSFAVLQDYSMRASSLSALRVLYTRFAAMQSKEELTAIASVARNCYPAFRLRGWLDQNT